MTKLSISDYKNLLSKLQTSDRVRFSNRTYPVSMLGDVNSEAEFILSQSKLGFALRNAIGLFKTGSVSLALHLEDDLCVLKMSVHKYLVIFYTLISLSALSLGFAMDYMGIVENAIYYILLALIIITIAISVLVWIEYRILIRFILSLL